MANPDVFPRGSGQTGALSSEPLRIPFEHRLGQACGNATGELPHARWEDVPNAVDQKLLQASIVH